MEASFKQDNKLNKAERYQTFLTQFTPLIEGEKNEISVLANTCAALKEAFDFFWVGFYLVHNSDQLNTFDETDRIYLEKVVALLIRELYFPQ